MPWQRHRCGEEKQTLCLYLFTFILNKAKITLRYLTKYCGNTVETLHRICHPPVKMSMKKDREEEMTFENIVI